MRATVVFLLCIFSFLQSGAHPIAKAVRDSKNSYAYTHKLEKRHSGKFSNKDQGGTLVDDTDFDVLEEVLIIDNLKNNANKFPAEKSFFSLLWNCEQTVYFNPTLSWKGVPNFTPFSNFTPIYITQRVLRI